MPADKSKGRPPAEKRLVAAGNELWGQERAVPEKLGQSDLDLISAWLDGELDDRQARQVAAKVAADPAWAAEADALRRLDGLLDAWQAPPLRRDLSSAILARTRRPLRLPGWARALAPLAAAAAIFAAATVFRAPSPTPPPAGGVAGIDTPAQPEFDAQVDKLLAEVPEEDRLLVKNLDILADYDVLVSFETLQALDRLAQRQGGS